MNLIYSIEQNTPEWIAYKVGKFSASSADKLLMDKKTKGYQDLIDIIIEERITGQPAEGKFKGNFWTERGHEYEPEAVNDYELRHLVTTQKVGIIELDDWTVCSPDRLIGDDELLQVKCPAFTTQRAYLRSFKVPSNYFKQMQFELYVSGRKRNIFYSYHKSLAPVEIVVERDEKMIAEIAKRLNDARDEVLAEIKFLNSL